MLSMTQQDVARDLTMHFNSVADKLMAETSASTTRLINAITQHFEGVANTVSQSVTSLLDDLSKHVNETIDKTLEFSENTYQDMVNRLDHQISESNQRSSDLTNKIIALIDENIDKSESTLSIVEDAAHRVIDDAARHSGSLYNNVVKNVNEINDSYLDNIESNFALMTLSVNNIADQNMENSGVLIDRIALSVDESIDNTLANIEAGLNDPITTLERILKRVEDLIIPVEDKGGRAKRVFDTASTVFDAYSTIDKTRETSDQASGEYSDILDRLMSPENNIVDNINYMMNSTGVAGWILKPFAVILSAAGMVMSIFPQIHALMTPAVNQAGFDAMRKYVNSPYAQGEALSLAVRGFIEEETAIDSNMNYGVSRDKSEKLIEGSRQRMTADQLMVSWRREDITDSEFLDRMKVLGFADRDTETFAMLKDLIPSPSDLIMMSVREAFNPDAISLFKTDSDLPQDFVEHMGRQGYTEDWAEKYWIAHWKLPSATQGFEMFHRGVIGDDELNLLLKSLDYTPYWQDSLKQIAYKPLTRVDVRRMYKLGVLDEDQVKRRYLDLGYNDADAGLMTEFTVAFSDKGSKSEASSIAETARKEVEGLWKIGTLDDNQTISALEGLGYSQDEAGMLVRTWTTSREFDERRRIISGLTSRAIIEGMTGDQIYSVGATLGLSSGEIENVVRNVFIDKQTTSKLPTKAELKGMRKEGIINKAEWSRSMEAHGYNNYWIDKYEKRYKFDG